MFSADDALHVAVAAMLQMQALAGSDAPSMIGDASSCPAPAADCVGFNEAIMPREKVRRTQPCDACRSTRKRCNLERPQCSRCTAKNVPCVYAGKLSRRSASAGSALANMKKPSRAVTCVSCHFKKTKCDKLVPKCSNCASRGTPCEYFVPAPSATISTGSSESSCSSDGGSVSCQSPDSPEELSPKEQSPEIPSNSNQFFPLESFQQSSAYINECERLHPVSGSAFTDTLAISPSATFKRKRYEKLAAVTQSEMARRNVKTFGQLVALRLSTLDPSTENADLKAGRMWVICPKTLEKIYCCPTCSKEYSSSNGLKYHLTQHNKSELSELPSGYCVKALDVPSNPSSDQDTF
ncbi:hypothetical protein HDU84_003583 [Entophlyctis sp. JEL0112]|nr:hypothetical protein HDU84_003583 [Entophlyctis sp. JEL0112]